VSEASIPAKNWRQAAADLPGAVLHLAQSAASDIFCSVYPSAQNAWLIDAQLRLYRRSTRHNALMFVLGTFFVSQACAGWIAWQTRTTWWIAVSLASIGFDIVGKRLDAVQDSSINSIRLRALTCVVTTAVFTIAWASMSVFLWTPGNEINHMVVVLILACSIAAWTSIGAVHPATAVAAFGIYAVFLVGRLAMADSALDHTLATLSAIYIGLMMGQLVAVGTTSRRMFLLEHERAGLVEGLQGAKVESDRERARAMTAGRAKSQFLSNMNHELRTPMNAILGFSELIKHKSFGNDVEKYAEYAEIIHGSGRQLLSLIDDMLDLARIEGGRLGLREASVDVRQIIAEAAEGSEDAVVQAQLSLVRRVARGLPRLHADERALRQIIGHLLSNAIKFTPAGGCVTIFAQVESDGRPSFGVEDTGIGIAVEDQATVFERFGKGRHDVTPSEKGTGLGLAIVRGFAEAHDGEALLESAPGTGTRVTVYLPVSRIEQPDRQRKLAG
jgi:two-component system cell cycle sensor histidine kinase PleC